jgi:hypothetical protein
MEAILGNTGEVRPRDGASAVCTGHHEPRVTRSGGECCKSAATPETTLAQIAVSRAILGHLSSEIRITSTSGPSRALRPSGEVRGCKQREKEVSDMTDRRQLIRDASCWALALSVGLALSPTNSEAQPPRRGPPPRRRNRRRGSRWGFHFGWGPKPRRHCWWSPSGRRHCRWW